MELELRKVIQFLLILVVLLILMYTWNKFSNYFRSSISVIDDKISEIYSPLNSIIFVVEDDGKKNYYKYRDDKWLVSTKKDRDYIISELLKDYDYKNGFNKLIEISKKNGVKLRVYDKNKDEIVDLVELNNDYLMNLVENVKDFKVSDYRDLDSCVITNRVLLTTYKNLGTENINYLDMVCKKYNIDPYFVLSVIAQESRGNRFAVSYTGCSGLFQFCYNTAFNDPNFNVIFNKKPKKLCKVACGIKCKEEDIIKYCDIDDPRFDAKKSIEAGVKYLAMLKKKRNGNITKILMDYNAGAGDCNFNEINLCDLTESKKTEVINYVLNIMNYYSSNENKENSAKT